MKWWQEFINIDESRDGLIKKIQYLKLSGLKLYEQNAAAHFFYRKKFQIKSLSEDQLVHNMFCMSLDSNCADISFYRANASAFLQTLRPLLDPLQEKIEKHESSPKRDLIIYNYYHFFQEILHDAVLLLNQYELRYLKLKSSQYLLGKYPIVSELDYFIAINQLIFGQRSFNSSWDKAPSLSLAIIRMMIEVRLRLITGIVGSMDLKKNIGAPLPMRVIFDLLEENKNDFDLSVSISSLKKIYSWTSIFLHTSLKPYLWQPLVIRKYLYKFMMAQILSRRSKDRLFMPRKTIEKILSGARKMLKKKSESRDVLCW